MGALVTLELPDDSPILALPWIITFGPLDDDEEWEPVVCGPYERPHALALAESVVADEELMAVVEPLLPRVSAEEIRAEIAAAQIAAEAEDEAADLDDTSIYGDYEDLGAEEVIGESVQAPAQAGQAPDPTEVRAGIARIAAMLTRPSA
ncbi:hypothetical protein [Plantactinospora endophytica]|uniref:Uncharacterized protein n=1 Tax=Plantactinospora endophytica TaxID=673535 RepID=A0ABQ4DT99_9ACTN|nr:hypothetical protein [Plantactinospora endophytica]GIG85664.1 hypothetical protein Pen02_06000 [Plantactinospora endophytica]